MKKLVLPSLLSAFLSTVAFLFLMRGVVHAAAGPEGQAAMVRAVVRQALAIPYDSVGPVKCGFPLCAAAYRARTTLRGSLVPYLTQILSRTERQKQRSAEHFTVHYDTVGPQAPSLLDLMHTPIPGSAEGFVDSVLAIASAVYTYEVDTLGYLPPPSDGTAGGGPEYDIYIVDLGTEYGETTPEIQLDARQDGGKYTSYLTIDNDFAFVSPDSNKGLPALRVTLAHEFHHAIQLGNYGYWTNETYFYELTSTWMETMAFPAITDYLNYVRASWGHFRNPGTPFTSNDIIEYSRCVWGIYLSREFGSGIMREIWEDIRNEAPLGANATVLARHGTSFASVFSEWNLWNYYTADRSKPDVYYPNGSLYPRVASSGVDFSPAGGGQSLNGSLPSLSARYYDVAAVADTGTVIITNLDAATALNPTVPQRPYTLMLSPTQNDASYEHVVDGCFYSVTYDDPTVWKSWVVAGGGSNVAGVKNGVPFPNPFRNDGVSKLFIPADVSSATLRIYDSAMGLVFENSVQPGTMFGKNVFAWDGVTLRGRRASSGVYYFTLEYSGGTITGKFVILRNAK